MFHIAGTPAGAACLMSWIPWRRSRRPFSPYQPNTSGGHETVPGKKPGRPVLLPVSSAAPGFPLWDTKVAEMCLIYLMTELCASRLAGGLNGLRTRLEKAVRCWRGLDIFFNALPSKVPHFLEPKGDKSVRAKCFVT